MLSSKARINAIPWGLLTLETVLIVLSVLLALGLNNWRENRANEDLAQRALQTVVDEAMENCTGVRKLLPYHRAVMAGETEYEGLGRILIRNDAWSAAQTAGAAHHVDYEVATAVGSVHALQSDHRNLVQAGIQAVYIAATNQDPNHEEFQRILKQDRNDWLTGPHPLMLADLIRVQENLLEAYHELFVLAHEHYGDAVDIAGPCDE